MGVDQILIVLIMAVIAGLFSFFVAATAAGDEADHQSHLDLGR